jgi:hypothetical protein
MPDQVDADYLKAVSLGDNKQAQKALDKAITAAGTNTNNGRYWWHASPEAYDTPRIDGKFYGLWFSPTEEFARNYVEQIHGRPVASVIKAALITDKLWDFRNAKHFDEVNAWWRKKTGKAILPKYRADIKMGNYDAIETLQAQTPDGPVTILDAIRALGYDSVKVRERGQDNIGILGSADQVINADPAATDSDGQPLLPSQRLKR